MMRLAGLRWWHAPAPKWSPKMAQELRRWGLPGAVGTLLALATAVLVLFVLPRLETQMRADEASWREARTQASAVSRLRPGPADPAEAYRRFQAAFPPAQDRHRRITNLLALAAGMGLQPRRSDVRSLSEAALGLTRVRVTMPLNGSYESLRLFVDQALRDDPALSLDLLRLERTDTQSPALRAELQWSLWMQAAVADESAASSPVRGLP